MGKIINFEVESTEIIEENADSQFATAKLLLFSSGKNRHDMVCSEKVLRSTAPTAYEKPIVFEVDERFGDFGTHGQKTVPAGFIVKDSAEFLSQADGRVSMFVLGKVWKRYSGKFLDVFRKNKKTSSKLSVEMELLDAEEMDNGLLEMKNFEYSAACILGDLITEASPGANIEMLTFAEEYEKDLKKEFGIKRKKKEVQEWAEEILGQIDKPRENFGLFITMPYESLKDINPALKGIDPAITLAQANQIARMADAIGADKGGWGIAISNFKKSHKVEDGKWVKKSNKEKNSMDEFDEKENANVTQMASEENVPEKEESNSEEMAAEQPEKEEMAAEESEEEEEEEESEEMAAEKPEEEEMAAEKEEQEEEFSLSANLDVAAALAFLEEETESYREIVAEFAKTEGEINYGLVCSYMFERLQQMKNQMGAYMAENEELKNFKAEVEKRQFDFEVETTLNEVSSAGMPKEDLESLREESQNFSMVDIDVWKNAVKAKAFTFSSKNKGENEKIGRAGLAWARSKGRTNSSPWVRKN